MNCCILSVSIAADFLFKFVFQEGPLSDEEQDSGGSR